MSLYFYFLKAKIEALGTKPMDQTLSLLRQLKYIESVMFAGKNIYTDSINIGSDESPCHADVDMILLDLL